MMIDESIPTPADVLVKMLIACEGQAGFEVRFEAFMEPDPPPDDPLPFEADLEYALHAQDLWRSFDWLAERKLITQVSDIPVPGGCRKGFAFTMLGYREAQRLSAQYYEDHEDRED